MLNLVALLFYCSQFALISWKKYIEEMFMTH